VSANNKEEGHFDAYKSSGWSWEAMVEMEMEIV